jgi:hypothetical protein
MDFMNKLCNFSFSLCLAPHFAIALKGLFPREALVYVPYIKPDKLVSDILAYNVHFAFPLNGALAKLRGLKSATFKKVRSRRLSSIFLLSFSLPCIAICLHARSNLRAHANPNSPQAYSDHQRFNGGPMAPLQVLRILHSHS